MGGKEQEFVNEAFETNWVAPLGPHVNGMEADLKAYLKKEDKQIACLSSGTAALHLALIALGVEQGDEVICQSLTFSASANPIVYQKATPIFVDSERVTGNICPIALENAIQDRIRKGKKPKVIIGVHLYGMPYQKEKIHEIAERYDIPVIEDSAEALGSAYQGEACGTFGAYGVLSFNGNKIITTSGGGALVCPSEKAKEKVVFWATQARDHAPHYQHSEIGYNYRMSNICAGIGRGQMMVLDKHIALRVQMNHFYRDLFKNTPFIKVQTEPSPVYKSNFWLTSVQFDPDSPFTREDMRLAFEKRNIESRPLWKPMHLQPVFADCPYYGGTVAEDLFTYGLCLPSGSNLTDADRSRIAEVVAGLV